VIEAVSIKNLRGIREGTLEGLTPLVVLVGPNSSGKSTILDALLIGASWNPDQGIGQALRRRSSVHSTGRWLFWRSGEAGEADIEVKSSSGDTRHRSLGKAQNGGITVMKRSDDPSVAPIVAEICLVEPHGGGNPEPLPLLYSRAVERGLRAQVTAMIAELLRGVIGIEILIDELNNPVVHLVYADHSVPVGLEGDGIQSLIRMGLEFAARQGGVVLLEEPEIHQHPAAIRQTARAIVAAVRRGIQVVLSTHSLELIDALTDELKDEELSLLSLYRLKLDDGLLRHSRLDGKAVLHSRGEIGDDLR